jgi:hypothetical protein
MKLHQSIVNENEITYGAPKHSTQLVDLTLKEIVDTGKSTNPYQLFILGRVACFFKNGLKSVDLNFENPVNFDDGSTSTETKEAIQMMASEDHVQLARYLLDCIKVGECMLHNKESNVIEWIKFVLKKQD